MITSYDLAMQLFQRSSKFQIYCLSNLAAKELHAFSIVETNVCVVSKKEILNFKTVALTF